MSVEHVASQDGAARPVDLLAIRGWALWNQGPVGIAYSIVMGVAALATTAILAVLVPPNGSDLVILLMLAALGLVQAELGRHVERDRRRITGTTHINLTSAWLLPAALLLPPVLAAMLVTLLYWHLHLRSWYRLKQVLMFRTVRNATVAILTCYATWAAANSTGRDGIREVAYAGWAGIGAIAIAIGTYFVVNMILVIPGMKPPVRSTRQVLGSWADNLLELATLCVGALVAMALATTPVLAVLVLPPLFLLHRAVLINQLESAARKDAKTGVWNLAGWHGVADRELMHAERDPEATFAVLMVDLDRFKRINDCYGHLAGDAALKTVADTITAAVRGQDSVGRFGGEEFLVLLPDTTPRQAHTIAERIRAAIAKLEITQTVAGREHTIRGLSASIGIASYPSSGSEIDRLLHAADAAMYLAKSNGRNQVASLTDPR